MIHNGCESEKLAKLWHFSHVKEERRKEEAHEFTKQQKQIETWNKTIVRLFAECILKSLYACEGQNVSLIRNVVNKLRVNGKNTHSHTRISTFKCVRETKYLCMPQGWSNCASSCEVKILVEISRRANNATSESSKMKHR